MRERYFGYALMGKRERRALLEYGASTSGKTLGTTVLKWFMPKGTVFAKTMVQIADPQFGLDGAEMSRLWVVAEMQDLDGKAGTRFATVFKTALGGDEIRINRKYGTMVGSEGMKPAIVMQSNKLIALPNEKDAVLGKVLVLHFRNSFLGKEDLGLEGKLWAERAGICRRLMEAARRLEAETETEKRWVMPESGKAVLREWATMSNPMDAFLGEFFVRKEKAVVDMGTVRAMRVRWEREKDRLLKWEGKRVSDNQLAVRLEEGSGWGLVRVQRSTGVFLRGMELKKEFVVSVDDEGEVE